MGTEENYELELDRERNRLFLTLEGTMDLETTREYAEDVLSAADQLQPGFDVVNDISGFQPVAQEATDAIEHGKEGLAERGVSAVVRIPGDSIVGKMQFDRVGDEDYHVATAENCEQAERFLDEFRAEPAGD